MNRAQLMEKEERLLEQFNGIKPDYNIHSQIARELFALYVDVREFEAAEDIIAVVAEKFPNHAHPLFRVNTRDYKIYMNSEAMDYNQLYKSYLKKALRYFPDAVYAEIIPYGFGTDLICYKDAGNDNVKCIELHNDDSDDEERQNSYKVSDIKCTHEKVRVLHMPREDV